MYAVYILLGILAVMLVLGVAAMIFFKLTIGKRDSWHRPEETVLGSGEKRALLIYQPSNHGHNEPQAKALAELAAARGYTVTMNYPSESLTYNPPDYDLLIFGSAAYMGDTSKALRNYIQAHPVTGRQVLLFVTGADSKAPELEALKLLIPDENHVSAVKVPPKDKEQLLNFAVTLL